MAWCRIKTVHLLDLTGGRRRDGFDETIYFVGIRFYDDFDSAVVAIFNGANDGKLLGNFMGRISKSDSLNAAGEKQNRSNHTNEKSLFERN